jgi:superfamily II DNA or RNA helicase
MSLKLDVSTISEEDKQKITSELVFSKKETQYNKGNIQMVYPYEIINHDIYLPFYYAVKILKKERLPREYYSSMTAKFTSNLRPLQQEVKDEALKSLNKNGTCLLSLYCGAGKTILSIYLACKIKLKTLILISRLVLVNQWKISILKVCPDAKIQILTTKSKIDPDADFYIMNAINVSKKERNFYYNMGTLIVDEVHLIATEILSKSLMYVLPRYSIALSATPTRPDGMDALIDVYWGPDRVSRKLYREHIAFKVNTGFEPEFSMGRTGRVDWNSVLESQCGNPERNELIIKIVKYFKNRNFLILTKRIQQGNFIIKRLEEEGEDVTSLIGVQKQFDFKSRILVATIQKAGVGFDHPKLDSLILASDVEEYFIQYLGRIMRKEAKNEEELPYIFDLVDNNAILKKHFYTRRKIYIDHGGKIKDFNKIYADKI